MVVVGHWLLTDITYSGGRLSGVSALPYVSWSRWATLLFQVMPVFFLVGGYANAVSWTAHRARGQSWTVWVRSRVMRLLWPTAVYVAVAILAVTIAMATGMDSEVLAQAGWLVAVHLWFLPVYLLLIALTPVLLAAHERWGFAVPLVMAISAAVVDTMVIHFHMQLIGFANYVLVWGCLHQWGFAWRDRCLTRSLWRPAALTVAGIILLAALVSWGPFPVDMIGAGQRVGNTSPPSVALLSFAAAQCGLLLILEPGIGRLLLRPRWWRSVTRLNTTVMNVYLWHFVPVIFVAVAVYTTGVMPQPAIGTSMWWALRPVWIALLAAALIPLTWAITWAEQPLRRLPAGIEQPRTWSTVLLALGMAAVVVGLARFAVAGFAPSGSLPMPALAAYTGGLLLVVASGLPLHRSQSTPQACAQQRSP
jgi:hypothetical protein